MLALMTMTPYERFPVGTTVQLGRDVGVVCEPPYQSNTVINVIWAMWGSNPERPLFTSHYDKLIILKVAEPETIDYNEEEWV